MSKLKERRREIAGMDLATAEEELKTLRRQLFDLRIQKERGEVKDTRQFSKTKNDIARLLYHIGELHHTAAMEAEGMGGMETAATPTPAPATPRASRATASAATSAPAATESAMTGATTPRAGRTAPAATTPAVSAGTTASTGAPESAAVSGTTAALPAAEPLATPELPAPTGESEE